MVTASVGVPPEVLTVTASLYLTLTDRVNPSDLSAVEVIHSTPVISAAPSDVDRLLIATKTSGSALALSLPLQIDPASRTQPPPVA